MKEIYNKLDEYKSLLDFNNEDRKKDFKSNFKFMQWSVKKMLKNQKSETDIIRFIQDAINIHTRTYSVYLNQI